MASPAPPLTHRPAYLMGYALGCAYCLALRFGRIIDRRGGVQ